MRCMTTLSYIQHNIYQYEKTGNVAKLHYSIPYWRYISAEISAEILTILLIWCRTLSLPKINLHRIFISAEYISPSNIYLCRNVFPPNIYYISISPPKRFPVFPSVAL